MQIIQKKLSQYMNNMQSKLLLFCIILIQNSILAQKDKEGFFSKLKDTKVLIYKSGPYIGLQRGKFTNLEGGYEFQWKKVKLVKPKTNSLHAGFSYNIPNNVIGYEVGFYNKTGRVNFTYGLNLDYYSDFTHSRIGIVPVIGYKLYGFHLQAGVNIMSPVTNFEEVNTLFLSLRFFIISKRNVDFKN